MFYAAKAYAALVGSIITALLSAKVIPVDGPWHPGLTIASVILTAIITFQVPNKEDPVIQSTGDQS